MWLDLTRSLLERTDDASTSNRAAVHLAQEVREAGAIFPLDVCTERKELEMIVVKAMAYECPWSRVGSRRDEFGLLGLARTGSDPGAGWCRGIREYPW